VTERRSVTAVCALVAALQLVGIHRPFLRHHESGGTQYGKHARNHLKFGLGTTHGIMLDVSGPRLDFYDDWRNYTYPDHPPLPALLLAAAYAVFGVHEAVLRALLMTFSVAAVLLFWRIARRRLERPWSDAAVAAFGLNPMFVYFSVVTVHQVNTLCGILAALLFYLRWRETGRRREYAGLVASIVFAGLCDWPGYYAAPAIVVAHLFSTREKRLPVLALIGVSVALFGLYLLWLSSIGGDAVERLLRVGAARSAVEMPPVHRYLAVELREVALYFTVALGLLALPGLWVRRRDPFLWSLLVLAADEVAFARISADHDYYAYYLGPFLALAGAEGLRLAAGRTRPLAWGAAVLFLAQSAWILSNRLTREGGYEFYHRLAGAIAEATRPEDKVLILTADIRFFTPYYADRYAVWHNPKEGELQVENSGGRRKGVGEEDVERLLRGGGLDVAVTAEKTLTVPEVPWLQGLSDEQLRAFGVETAPSPRRRLLEGLCGPPRVVRGFLFWDLRRP
jgi:hypothetical protein